MNTAILIAGMHRSGTSAATGALRFAQVSLGGELLEAGADNPKGYWENTRAVAIHEQLLKALDRGWDDVRPLPSGWEHGHAAAEARAQIHALIDEEFADKKLWAIKDPRLCRFVPLWIQVLKARDIRTVALFVARHPEEVAESIKKRNGWPIPVGKLLWMRYTFEAEAATRGLSRTVLSYDRLLDDPADALWGALGRLGVDTPPRDALPDQDLNEFVDSRDRHHVCGPGGPVSALDRAVTFAYEALIAIEKGKDSWKLLSEAADQAWATLDAAMPEIDAIAAVAREWQKRQEAAAVDAAEQRSKFIAQLRWSEEAVEKEQGLHRDLAAVREKLASQEVMYQRVEDLHGLLSAQAEQLQQLRAWASDAVQRSEDLVHATEQREQAAGALIRQREEELEVLRERLLETERTNAALQMRTEHLQAAAEQSARIAELLRAEAQDLRETGQTLRDEVHRLLQENHVLLDERQQAVVQLNLVLRSFTWRMTQPVRVAVDWIRRVI